MQEGTRKVVLRGLPPEVDAGRVYALCAAVGEAHSKAQWRVSHVVRGKESRKRGRVGGAAFLVWHGEESAAQRWAEAWRRMHSEAFPTASISLDSVFPRVPRTSGAAEQDEVEDKGEEQEDMAAGTDGAPVVDPLAGTIEEDEDYQAFLRGDAHGEAETKQAAAAPPPAPPTNEPKTASLVDFLNANSSMFFAPPAMQKGKKAAGGRKQAPPGMTPAQRRKWDRKQRRKEAKRAAQAEKAAQRKRDKKKRKKQKRREKRAQKQQQQHKQGKDQGSSAPALAPGSISIVSRPNT